MNEWEKVVKSGEWYLVHTLTNSNDQRIVRVSDGASNVSDGEIKREEPKLPHITQQGQCTATQQAQQTHRTRRS